ncbi:MAG TPA: MFS transporter [Gaiellaceae bacterium]|nr:MFS transporter [Gaiellaceae bacterium]
MSRPAQAAAALRAALHNPGIRRVELAWGAAIAAEWAHFVALGVFAYDAGGTAAVGVAGLVRMLPAALVAPLASTLGDRFRRERFMTATAALGALALGASALVFFTSRSEWLVFALAGVIGVASTLFRPALQAILPSLSRTPEELIAANGATSTIESLATLVGPLLAGVLVSVGDPGVVFAAAGGVLAAGALLLAPLRVEGVIQETAAQAPARELVVGGFRAVRSGPQRLILALMATQGFVRGCLNVLIVVAVFRVLDAGDGAVGYLTAALGLGGLLGAFGAMTLRSRRLAGALGVALVFWGLPIALFAPRPYLPAAVLLLAVVGAANSVEDVAGFTLVQRLVPDATLSRVLGLLWGAVMGAVALGSITAPLVVDALGPRAAFIVVGAVLPAVTLLSWPGLRRIDRRTAPPTAELRLVAGVPLFEPLSIVAKEHLAGKLTHVHVDPGEVVVRAGEVGDRFYIVGNGELEITNGVHGTAHGGDFFGEIALLRDVPRTATVRATSPSELYALDRADFLAALTHSEVRAAGDAVVDERLRAGLVPR